ncbi:MAG: hypothetical protein RIT45_4222 [Pseudomonadota bacterium]|jgi:rhodanese-related sulfurtransferase
MPKFLLTFALVAAAGLTLTACSGAQKTETAKGDCHKDGAKGDCKKGEGHAKGDCKGDCHKDGAAKGDCKKGECDDCKKKAAFQLVPGEVFAKDIEAGKGGVIFDVNSKERYLQGHLPGAVHAHKAAITRAELPEDTAARIVFYCGSPKCMASHKAAETATGLGYTNVWVMSDGIKGWEEKNLPTEKGGNAMAFGLIPAADLNTKMQGAAQIHVFDVNSAERFAKGHIAGAKHVSLKEFDAAPLPPNKDAMLVFYCGSPKCGASHRAAKLAAAKGYTNLWVMPDGIKGWEAAGLPTEK